ncbi:membrane protein [Brevibacillus panacihumi W25]|uniref:Membrane protein n=1 Tax=Brevibacillus panacihumi W25 TaxID=1408254 RepID=V6M6X1_9BACL|nr:hypothetical protein [Brevibacillus panacihumi]EST53625.1 membrane protein [Brevibacillus panacihumi W25]
MRNQTEGNTIPHISYFQGERGLVLTGLLAFLLAGICAVWVLLYGASVGSEGDVSKAFSFNAALGIFLLSTAAISPFSGMSRISRTVFRWSYILLALYSYFAENVQNFRGVDPRFHSNGSPFDYVVSNTFAFVALLLVLFYLFFGLSFFRKKAYNLHPELVLGIRYSMIAVLLSMAGGVWISFLQSRYTGPDGNIIWLHGIGFHALQVIPVAALLAKHALSAQLRSRWIHLTGLLYLLGLIAVGWQTYLGLSVLELSLFPLLAWASFVTIIAMGGFLLYKTVKNGQR